MSHLAPTRLYAFVFLSLVVLTVVTVSASRVDLGGSGNIVLGLLIAVVKASLVALFFMHLKHDAKVDLSLRYFAIFPLILFILVVIGNTPDIALRLGDQKPAPRELRQRASVDVDDYAKHHAADAHANGHPEGHP